MNEATTDAEPLVTVIVVNWNGEGIIGGCLDSLLAQELTAIRMEIVVVDNGSTDRSVALLSTRYPTIRILVLPENRGFAGGVNAGIEVAAGQTIVLVNNDATVGPTFVGAMVRRLQQEPRTAAVTGRILLAHRYSRVEDTTEGALLAADGAAWAIDNCGEPLVNSTGNEITTSGNGRDRDWLTPVRLDHRKSGAVMGFSGGAVGLRRSAVTAAGGFDHRLFMYYEDSDLSWRLRRAGWEITYEPEAIVYHQHAASSGTTSDFFLFHNERNRILVALKNAPASVIWRAFARSAGSLLAALFRRRLPVARRKLRSLVAAARMAPQFIADRRSIDRQAVVPRSVVSRHLVRDKTVASSRL